MNNWKIVGKIAIAFGVTCLLFGVFSAFIEYSLSKMTLSYAPTNYILLSLLSSMLPFLLFAALSFVVAGIALRTEKDNTTQNSTPQTQSTQ